MSKGKPAIFITLSLVIIAVMISWSWREQAPEGISHSVMINRVTNAYPAYSPDAEKIVYMSNSDGDFDIYVRSLREQVVNKLTDTPGQDGTPVWSPDGSRIAFRSMRDGHSQIYVMNADGSGQRNLSNNAFGDEHPFWSSDGKKILFCSDRTTARGAQNRNYDIFEMNADGSGVRQITHTAEVETYPSWSPDGSKIVCRKIMEDGDWEVVVINADGSNPVNISNRKGVDGWAIWSPDGKRIAFASEVGETMRLFVVNADGTGKKQVTHDDRPTEDRQPSWHPNGSSLLFARYVWFPKQVWDEASEIYETKINE